MDLCRLERPAFIIDRRKVLRNLERMTRKAAASDVRLRPHVKTHQSAAVAAWLRDFNVRCITVSSVDMASYFASAGWEDIMVAVPVNIHQIPAIDALADSCTLHVIVDSALASEKLVESIRHRLHVWIEMDTGYHRTGVPVEDTTRIVEIARVVRQSPCLNLKGIMVHDGHTYSAAGPEEVHAIFQSSFRFLKRALEALKAEGFPDLELSIGDTPTCSILEQFPAPISEIRPGNFIFYDLTQAGVGACAYDDIAAAVACPVISLHPERGEVIIYGGGVHFSKEFLKNKDGSTCYGRICRLNEKQTGWMSPLPEVSLVSISQEHGIVRGPSPFVESVELGGTLIILPVHACLTANLYEKLQVLGEGPVTKFRL